MQPPSNTSSSSNKRHKTSTAAARSRPESPLSLYKQALRLVRQQPCGDTTSDTAIEDKLQKAKALLLEVHEGQQDGSDQGTVVSHSIDLELSDEPLFLLASIHLQLGQLYQRQDNLAAAEAQYRTSLQHFPRFVAALSAWGQVLKSAASSPASLQQAEQLLQQAVDVAHQLSEEEGGMLVESNQACAAELDAGDAARGALAMLLCQSGRCEAAAPHLQAFGFKYRLSQEVLCYHIPRLATSAGSSDASSDDCHDTSSSSTCSFMQAVDGALPPALLQHLQHIFWPGADFWLQHAYGRVGYFSYYFSLQGSAGTSSMHQLAHHLQQLGSQYFPDVKEAQYAEFWAHCRRHSSGHQLHFDSDDEGQGGVRHPIITAIVYLSDSSTHSPPNHTSADPTDGHGQQQEAAAAPTSCRCRCKASDAPTTPGTCSCQPVLDAAAAAAAAAASCVGGPTLMTDQVLGGPLATQGWLAYPAVNRVVFFDGRYLHGVIPGRGPEPAAGARRCTLMMAFWRDLKCRTPPGQGVGACMAMPDPAAGAATDDAAADGRSWHQQLQPLTGDMGECTPAPLKQLQHVSAVWQSIDGGSSTRGAAYNACYQGF